MYIVPFSADRPPGHSQVGPAGDRPLYARYVDGHVTAHVTGRVNRLLARVGVGNQVQLVRILTTLLSELKRFRRILQKHFVNIPRA